MRGLGSMLMTLVGLALALLGTPAHAQLQTSGGNNIAVSLVPEGQEVQAGRTVALAIAMKPQPGWHGYWKNPGDAGMPMRVEWSLPAGLAAGEVRFPVPDRLVVSGLMNYVYKGDYAHLVDLRIPSGLPSGTRLPISARLDYLACTDEICVPETATVSTALRVGSSPSSENSALLDRFRQALPKPLGSDGRFEVREGKLRLAIPIPASLGLSQAYFFPLTHGAIDYAAPQSVSRSGDTLILETEAARSNPVRAVEGVLKVGEGIGLSLNAVPGPVPAPGTPLAGPETAPAASGAILAALAGALIGGILLNIMPCVFPILSLKALSLARAGGEEAAARRDALAYTAGVVIVCLALGGLLLGLRAGGAAIGWAFQLQDPRVILFLLLLVSAIALNLAGLFELPAIAGAGRLPQSGGAAGSFWTGALAAFVATPCTGPFMGAALGAALVLPTPAALAVFGGLGLGLALPFLLIGFVPAIRSRLPKPGPWMARFRKLMSVPMFLTAAALAWILERQTGATGLIVGMAAAMLLAGALWWVGRRQRRGQAWVRLAPAAALAGMAGMAAMLLVPTATTPASAKPSGALRAEPFSERRLADLQAANRPVFVYFTADWCVSCKVNEKASLEQEEVARVFAARKVAVLVGDWTRGDAAIGRFLERHGRSGVPLYLYYGPGKPAEILPQVLTTGRLISAVS